MSDEPCTPLTERVLDLAVERRRGVAVVSAAGEIDLCSAPGLADALAERSGPVVLDLTRVAFLSAAGVQVMLEAQARGCDLRLVVPRSGRLLRIFDVTGLTAQVPRFDSVVDAVGS
ncbi:hypothetical protein GCM10027445_08110 [Amycolatopsis endophytica]|uniref:Anti-anti-sigma factor n=1 Tax=Amycolatopsis endophytica TaxID=860233 RepID=A0A853AWI2_9PSEU|nr:STAS domain-containing protein [Amycolatopsis endophytica]NYI87050.1 anti-anti-sigma factor [Amycolatopsis endophytica]